MLSCVGWKESGGSYLMHELRYGIIPGPEVIGAIFQTLSSRYRGTNRDINNYRIGLDIPVSQSGSCR